jgi:hypothetical protein
MIGGRQALHSAAAARSVLPLQQEQQLQELLVGSAALAGSAAARCRVAGVPQAVNNMENTIIKPAILNKFCLFMGLLLCNGCEY